MTTTKPLQRRAILAAVSVLGTASVLEPTTASVTDTNATDDQGHGVEGRMCTLKCDQEPEAPYEEDCCDERWSAITIKSCSSCERAVRIRATADIADEHESYGRDHTVHVNPGERVTLWYATDLEGLETEPGDLNIAISQRNLVEVEGSLC